MSATPCDQQTILQPPDMYLEQKKTPRWGSSKTAAVVVVNLHTIIIIIFIIFFTLFFLKFTPQINPPVYFDRRS